jgi:putative transcriptional regulator
MSDSDIKRHRTTRNRPASFTAQEEAWLDARTEAEIEAAAAADADNPPLTPEQLPRARPVVAVAELRRKLGLTQLEFARRYRLPIGTVRDWEQGRSIPDAPARALLRAIDGEPEMLANVLEA